MHERRNGIVSGLLAVAVGAAALTFLPVPGAGQDNLVAHVAEGRAAFVKVCGVCHGIDKPEKKNMDRPSWDELITSMEAKGAKMTAEERELILDYLGIRNVFLSKCTACHTTERILDRNRPYQEWEKTVEKMVNKGPGLLAEGEARSITAYLTAIRGLEPAAK
jgi:mono/diheme cytochrome c family protein